ncbi:MAG: S-layer homology domain-containing protein [Ruminiclostridium sp.]|nr:S-layer homology domain-containing protein [Ruminiclostridium sp.]
MKQTLKKLLAAGLSVVMLTSLVTPALAYDTFSTAPAKEMTLLNDKGREITFVDLYGGQTTDRPDTSDEVLFYMDAIEKNGILQEWATLGYLIHEKNRGSYSDLAGNGWDEDFGQGHYMDYIYDMQHASSIHDWDGSNYCKVSTGLSVADSLYNVQSKAADEIADQVARKMSGGSYLKRHPIEIIDEWKAEQDVIYSTVTTVDQQSTNQHFYYNSFTIAFYDFKLHPLEGGVLSGEVTVKPDESLDAESIIGLFTNTDRDDSSQELYLNNTVTETFSTSINNSESYTFGTNVGMEVPLKWKTAGGHFEGGLTIHGDFTYDEVVSTAYTQANSKTTELGNGARAYMNVPGHTIATAIQTTSTATETVVYDCPVGLTYRVAIFSMCGDVYDDDLLVQDFKSYEQRTFVTIFGNDKDGSDAVENLYQRAIKHKSTSGYDSSYGLTKGSEYQDGSTWCDSLDWNEIIKAGATSVKAQNIKDGETLINHLGSHYPMSITGATTTIQQDYISTVQDAARPLYPIASTYINWQMDNEMSLDRTLDMTVGDTFPITSYRVKASDKDGVPYHGFVSTWGNWKIVDANGKESTSSVAKMENDSVTGSQILTATAPGTIYVKYFIPENTYYTYDGVASTNANISSPAYKVVVSAVPEEEPEPFQGTLEVSGSVEATVGETENLNALLTVTACDPTGKEVEAGISWEAKELASKGITVTPEGVLTCTKPGIFHVRAYVDDVYSNWVEVVAAEPVSLILGIRYHPFTDVPYTHWANDAVGFVYQNDIMNGVKAEVFNPTGQVTRAQVAQTLYNLAGKPLIVDENPFADVAEDAWYAKAVVWAAENGLTTGVKADTFAPNDPVTREQLVTFLCRYADWKGLDLPSESVDLNRYQDAGQVSGWAKDFIVRALAAQIIQGKSDTILAPGGVATRAEIAQIFMNMLAE